MLSIFRRLRYWFACRRCWKCGGKHLTESSDWTRGYNDLCRQASGSTGKRCFDCGFIHFEKSHAEYAKTLPEWVRPKSPSLEQMAYDSQRETGIDHYGKFHTERRF